MKATMDHAGSAAHGQFHYAHSTERTQEILRLAIAAMARGAARPTPIAYAVWFEHLGGTNAALSGEIEQLGKTGKPLTDEDMVVLYQRFVMGLDALATSKIGEDLGRVLSGIQSTVKDSRASTEQFQSSLERFRTDLDSTNARPNVNVEDAASGVRSILMETGSFNASVSALDNALAASQDEIGRLKRELVRVREEVFSDALTGLTNRRGFDSAVVMLSQMAKGPGGSLALIMLDIDHFKRINDKFGHVVGDRVIKGVGAAIANSVKKTDVAARYGGEEFAILLPNAHAEAVREIAERVRDTVSRASIKRLDKQEAVGSVTLSGGVAFMLRDESITEFIHRADQALYAAKEGGRNRVVVS